MAVTGDIRRHQNQKHYASYAGTAPIDVSVGDQETHWPYHRAPIRTCL